MENNINKMDNGVGMCKQCKHPFEPHIVIAFDTNDFSKGGEMKCPVEDCMCHSTISFISTEK